MLSGCNFLIVYVHDEFVKPIEPPRLGTSPPLQKQTSEEQDSAKRRDIARNIVQISPGKEILARLGTLQGGFGV
jgi:hypothetical protein